IAALKSGGVSAAAATRFPRGGAPPHTDVLRFEPALLAGSVRARALLLHQDSIWSETLDRLGCAAVLVHPGACLAHVIAGRAGGVYRPRNRAAKRRSRAEFCRPAARAPRRRNPSRAMGPGDLGDSVRRNVIDPAAMPRVV